MTYTVLALKYRPQFFEDLVGQTPVSRTLTNALESNRVAHAYIFSGPRGVGKTTTARILAKCLNCEKGPTAHPCNTCDSCLTIGRGASMDDVLEIDGASNRGIDQIRDLRENAKYTPAKSRYRIYIIDEAHQITKDAFGALLKTLEEPPPHVVFMMATTEVFKIPSPILSRCQRFSLKPIAPDLVFGHLKKICEKEKIRVEDDALKHIVRFVEGSLRDALSLLDQALVFAPEGITTGTLRELLGLLPVQVVRGFAEAIREGNPEKILQTVSTIIQDGIDLTQLGKDLQNHYHTLLLLKAGVQDPLLTLGEGMKQEADRYGLHTLERNIRLLARAMEDMRRSETPRAIFEIQALKMGQQLIDLHALTKRLGELTLKEGGPASRPTPPPTPSPSASQPPKMNVLESPKNNLSAPTPSSSNPAAQPPKPPVEAPSPGPKDSAVSRILSPEQQERIRSGWASFLDEVSAIKQSLASALEEGRLEISEPGIALSFTKRFPQQLVDRATDQLRPVLMKVFGFTCAMRTELGEDSRPPARTVASANPPSPAEDNVDKKSADESHYEEVQPKDMGDEVQKAVKFFPGVVKKKADKS